ncbi:MAG: hypothetical protein H3C35_13390 [Bacteroidetes bacterium]|nr:hypothetical protein [Bacteroidota bacterium]
MKEFFIGIISGIILAAASYFYFHKTPAPQRITFYEQLPPDTIPVPVPVIKIKIDSTGKAFWKKKYDSLQNFITGKDTTQSGDSVFADYFLPFKARIEDSTSINYVTATPLAELERRIILDSTFYKPIKVTIPPPIVIEPPWYDHWYIGALGAAVIFVLSK